MKIHKELPTFSLEPDTIHVWLFRLDGSHLVAPAWGGSLSKEEKCRSKQYKFEIDRLRFIARRGILRQLLGWYCGLPAAKIVYHTNPNGKLSFPSHRFSFNLSSSQEWIAFAFVLEKEIGVDIEQVRPLPDLPRMAERWFSTEERCGLLALPPDVQMDAFFHIWTQKEAYIKACGMGLSYPLEDFSVSVDPMKPAGLISIKGDSDDCSSWKLSGGIFESGWRVAVCVRAEADPEILWYMPNLADVMTNTGSCTRRK